MRLHDGVGLICLSCVLMILYLISETSSCPPAWFGARCQYKCRCVNDKCDHNGMCTGGFSCQGGWFGPACQYVDLAYLHSGPLRLTDGDDSTCIHETSRNKITISLNETHFFTWMRILISKKDPAVLDDLKVAFSVETVPVICDELKIYVVDKSTRDIHCSLTQAFNELTLTGRAVTSLCSVYISGGRNVALKENVSHNSSNAPDVISKLIKYTADLAVDGNTRQHLKRMSCSAGYKGSILTVRFSLPRKVQRYVIYNSEDSKCLLVYLVANHLGN
ncbi:hypothetical protein BsWGS_24546 [Bradybaena similaris]